MYINGILMTNLGVSGANSVMRAEHILADIGEFAPQRHLVTTNNDSSIGHDFS